MIRNSGNRLSHRTKPYTNLMIAPEANDGKGLEGIPADHGFVSKIIKLPNFGQGTAKLASRMVSVVTSGPVSRERRIPQPPSPPGLEQTGPVVSRTVQSPTL